MHAPEEWHPSVLLDDFLNQIGSLQQLVDMTRTPKLGSFDRDTVRRAMGWGLYVEQVIGSLTSDWQRDSLVRGLEAGSKAHHPQATTLPRLRQARSWVLQSMLGSTFLADHPKPQSLLRWIMEEYLEAVLGKGLDQVGPQQSVESLSKFIGDATDVVKSSGNTAALSHTFSTLSVCSMVADCDEYSVTLSRHPPEVTARAPVESETCIGPIDDGKQRKRRREPWTYDTSVETAQKRAYATNSYRILLSEVLPVKRDHRRDRQERAADEGTSFIAKMASLAISDVVVLEVMCLMLLEPWRTCGVGKCGSVTSASRAMKSSDTPTATMKMLLDQVIVFRGDERLWSLDPWLLDEVSKYYSVFADVYVTHLLTILIKVRSALDQGNGALTDNLVSERETAKSRLTSLSSRGGKLGVLCRLALSHTANTTGNLEIISSRVSAGELGASKSCPHQL